MRTQQYDEDVFKGCGLPHFPHQDCQLDSSDSDSSEDSSEDSSDLVGSDVNSSSIDIDLTCPDPAEVNPLQVSGFVLTINRIPEVKLWLKTCVIPDVTCTESIQETRYTPRYIPGVRPEFGALQTTITIDHRMDAYAALYEWLTLITAAHTGADVKTWKNKFVDTKIYVDKDSDKALCSEATLTILGANQTPVRSIVFHDLFITSLSSFQITEDTSETQYVTVDATFRYFGKFDLGPCLL